MTTAVGRRQARLRSSVGLVLVAVMLTIGTATHPGTGLAAIEIHKVDEATFNPSPGEPFFVAVIGNDARPGQTVSRGDALHLIGVNPAQGRATILNIPRDTYVEIPGRGRDKINSAHASGGPALQAQALENLVGVKVSFVISTGFEGLTRMVDDLGGVDVDIPVAMNDPLSGAVFPQGRRTLNGNEALALTRNRHLGGGDFARTHNQGILILAALAKFRAEEPTPVKVMKWMAVLGRHTQFENVSLAELFRLARFALRIDPAAIVNVTMPGSSANIGGASVVLPTSGAEPLFADFRDDGVVAG